ncbi:MAG TPA: hypothetical protein DCO77_09390 [Nitrospiraceae bacterium]|nr:hypothetical protein [Nitrospiraceae bacterium]
MNILFVNNFRGRGGGEEFLRDLLPGLLQKGVTVGLVCRPGTPLEEMFRHTAVTVHAISRSGWGALTSVFTIARIIQEGNYGIVNIQRGHDIIQSWIAAFFSRKSPLLAYTVQVPEFRRSPFLLNRMRAIITVSRYIQERLVSYRSSLSSRTTVINYGIDTSVLTHNSTKKGFLKTKYSLPEKTKIIGTVGDLWKNQIEFLDALLNIRMEFPDARFALVASEIGIGQIDEFKIRAESLGLSDAILWIGRLSKDKMSSFYADIDIAVSTHRNEGFGIWILEALAMGKPVVAFDAGGVRDPLDGCPSGVLVNGTAGEMARQIIEIFHDKERYNTMATSGLKWVEERFTNKQMIQNYYQYFHELAR